MRSPFQHFIYKLSVITLLMLSLVGCFDPATDKVVVLAGDSIMQGAVSQNLNMLLGHDNAPILIVNAMGGSPLTYQEYNAGRLSAIHNIVVPDMIFLSMGTIDRAFGLESFVLNIEAFMANVDPSTEIFWIPPHRFVPGGSEFRNAVIEASYLWQNMRVLDLPVENRHVQADSIHLNIYGNKLLGEMILAEIKNHGN